MTTSDITALFFGQEEIPMALLFGPETVIPARRCAISVYVQPERSQTFPQTLSGVYKKKWQYFVVTCTTVEKYWVRYKIVI